MRNLLIGMVIGLMCGASATAFAQVLVKVPSNGVLKGYIVQKNGKVVCRDPEVWNQFRGPESYVICP